MIIANSRLGVRFYMTRKSSDAPPQTVVALTQLSKLGFVGSLDFILLTVSRIVYFHPAACEPAVWPLMICAKELLSMIWIIVLLVILGAKISKNEAQQFT